MKRAIMMRGIPGSGKSSTANWVARQTAGANAIEWLEDSVRYFGLTQDKATAIVAIHSTDQYYIGEDGSYNWNASKVSLNHNRNYKAFKDSIEQGIPLVIVDNTNTTKSEYEKYLKFAQTFDYWVSMMVMAHPTVGEAVERNVHNVPADVIKKMLQRFE